MKRPLSSKRPIGPFFTTRNTQPCSVKITGVPLVDYGLDEVGYIPTNDDIIEARENDSYRSKFIKGQMKKIEDKKKKSPTKNLEVINCNFDLAVLRVNDPIYTPRYTIRLADSDGAGAGEMWIVGDEDISMMHLFVPLEYRGSSSSDILMAIFVGYAIATDSTTISGSVGGGERTKSFFKKMGIPEEDIEMVSKDHKEEDSVTFETQVKNIDINFTGNINVMGEKVNL